MRRGSRCRAFVLHGAARRRDRPVAHLRLAEVEVHVAALKHLLVDGRAAEARDEAADVDEEAPREGERPDGALRRAEVSGQHAVEVQPGGRGVAGRDERQKGQARAARKVVGRGLTLRHSSAAERRFQVDGTESEGA